MTEENTQVVAPESSEDNSTSTEVNYEEEIAKALEEPEESLSEGEPPKQVDKPEDYSETQDNTVKCPDKFKKEDGSVDVNNLLKSYTELESMSSSQKNTWEKERAELQSQIDAFNKQQQEQAQQYGFNSPQEMANAYELVNTEANEYYKYVSSTEDPAVVTEMLRDYIANPTDQKREEIELEFSPEVIRRVTAATERKRFQLEQQSQQYAQTAEMTQIEETIKQLCQKHNDILQNEDVKKFVVDQFNKFGSGLDFETASAMLSLLEARESSIKKTVDDIASKQNNKATDKIAAISNSSSAPSSDDDNVDFDKLSPKEQAKLIDKYI